jgi:phosphate/sulfate permease
VLATADLIVGVSNDAVNFLNSAIGSKAISMRTILIVAGVGVLVGAVFSSGLMEVARKGVFAPDLFYFDEIIIIFLAVLITDILLVDIFNSIGIPISTTVSVIFELLGASVCVALLKLYNDPSLQQNLTDFINIDKAFAYSIFIIGSVFISFFIGAIVQYLSRLVFTFKYDNSSIWLRALFGGISLASITYFILIKGINTISFVDQGFKDFIKSNTYAVVVVCFAFWISVSYVIKALKSNLFKFIIVFGTFALALAFAGNDLVNFIGVSIAAWQSFQLWLESFHLYGTLPSEFKMTALSGEISTPNHILFFAGLVMVLTLWFSSKAQYVVQTGVNLSRQGEGEERFNANKLSRLIVRSFFVLGITINKLLPNSLKAFIDLRFEKSQTVNDRKGITKPAFDMLRASVNLVVASILITIATNYTLPLSTTYITFMVAMGTSFGDKAWGRESAVYRVAGVLNVLGSWVLTALIAFTAAFVIALFVYYGGIYAAIALVIVVFAILIKTGINHSRKVKAELKKKRYNRIDIITINDITSETSQNITRIIQGLNTRYIKLVNSLGYHDHVKLKKISKQFPELENEIVDLKGNVFYCIKSLESDTVEASKFYLLTIDYLQDMVRCMSFMINSSSKYVSNNHRNLKFNQIRDLKRISSDLDDFFNQLNDVFEKNDFDEVKILLYKKNKLLDLVSEMIQKQIERIRTTDMGQQNTDLYFGILLETKDMIIAGINLLNLFYDYHKEAKQEF